jgi:CRP/FNR family cyclic AMP-dependent transcriptional regulator
MSAELFWTVLRGHPDFAGPMLEKLTSQARLLSDRVVEFSTLGVKNRIHAELLHLAREQEPSNNRADISPVPTHADIASRVSTRQEAVTRELNGVIQSGLLENRNAH